MNESKPVLDVDALLESVAGDLELLDEMAAAFAVEVPKWTAALRAALDRGDPEAIFRAAHGVSGAVGYFRARAVQQQAMDLEALGRAGRLDGAAGAIDRLAADLLELSRLLDQAPWRR